MMSSDWGQAQLPGESFFPSPSIWHHARTRCPARHALQLITGPTGWLSPPRFASSLNRPDRSRRYPIGMRKPQPDPRTLAQTTDLWRSLLEIARDLGRLLHRRLQREREG